MIQHHKLPRFLSGWLKSLHFCYRIKKLQKHHPFKGIFLKRKIFFTCLKARLVGETSSDSTSVLPVTDSSGVVMDVVLCSHYGRGVGIVNVTKSVTIR